MLQCQCGQVGIRDEIRVHPRHGNELAEQLSMALRRLGNPRGLTVEPRQDLTPCIRDWFGTFEHPRIRHEPQEGKQTRPR